MGTIMNRLRKYLARVILVFMLMNFCNFSSAATYTAKCMVKTEVMDHSYQDKSEFEDNYKNNRYAASELKEPVNYPPNQTDLFTYQVNNNELSGVMDKIDTGKSGFLSYCKDYSQTSYNMTLDSRIVTYPYFIEDNSPNTSYYAYAGLTFNTGYSEEELDSNENVDYFLGHGGEEELIRLKSTKINYILLLSKVKCNCLIKYNFYDE
jgi:hypothetical protein